MGIDSPAWVPIASFAGWTWNEGVMPRRARFALLTLAAIACGADPVAAQRAKPASGAAIDPTAKAILDRHLRASQPTRPPKYGHLVTEMRSGDSPAMRVERFTMLPDRVLTRSTIPGFGVTEAGYDGKVGWTVSPLTGPVLLEGDPLKQLKATGPTTSMLAIETFVGLALGGRELIDGRAVDAVFGASANGDSATYYFDVGTGLLAALRTHRSGGLLVDSTTLMLFADYKRLAGTLMATKVTVRMPGHELVVRTIHMDHDPIDSAKFAAPDVLRTMVKRAP